jgi:hypothetical protein
LICTGDLKTSSVGPEALQMGFAELEGFMKVEGLNIKNNGNWILITSI